LRDDLIQREKKTARQDQRKRASYFLFELLLFSLFVVRSFSFLPRLAQRLTIDAVLVYYFDTLEWRRAISNRQQQQQKKIIWQEEEKVSSNNYMITLAR
jgi:hypothetical protein